MPRVYNKRGTRAALNALAASNDLAAGEIYLISDENRLAIGLSPNTYETYAKQSEAGGGSSAPKWAGKLAVTFGNGNPDIGYQLPKSSIAPSNITTSIGRVSLFRLEYDILVDAIRAFTGNAVLSGAYKMALYRVSDGVRLTGELAFDVTAGGSIVLVAPGLNLSLSKNILYAAVLTVSSAASSSTAILCITATNVAGNDAPLAYAGKMDLDAFDYFSTGWGKVTLTGGALPTTLPTLQAPGLAQNQPPIFIMEAA